jgi:hypothetical protein
MSSARPPLPTTAYAVLALLVPGELSSRELVVRYHERFGDVWPRTAALVYEQARRLVRLELMAMRGSGPGRVCAITDDGREAMSAWHATTPAAPRIDLELAVRLASSTDVGHQRQDIRRVGAWADGRIAGLDERLRGDPPPVGQAMGSELLRGVYVAISDWADRSA